MEQNNSGNGPHSCSTASFQIDDLLERLNRWFQAKSARKLLLLFSGGVDSVTLGKAAQQAFQNGILRHAPLAIFGTSETGTKIEQQEAPQIAQEIGLELLIIPTDELTNPAFSANDPRRCYYCKAHRFAQMIQKVHERLADSTLFVNEMTSQNSEIAPQNVQHFSDSPFFFMEGSNADDETDYRPGRQAVDELGIASPFAELGITKSQIRALADHWNLSVAQKPSNPCLATRIAYGLPLTCARLRRVERAESFLHSLGLTPCRVRMDDNFHARIEVSDDQIAALVAQRHSIVDALTQAGFQYVSLDLQGFQSGKMNRLVLEKT